MDYSLLSKFRGAWLGSIIAAQMKGEDLASRQHEDLHSGLKNQQQPIYLAENNLLDLGKQQWRSLTSQWEQNSATTIREQEASSSPATVEAIALISLPIILYYHDYWTYLANFLLSQGKRAKLTQSNLDCLLIWAFTIRLGLRGAIDKQDPTQQILQGADLNNSSPRWLSTIKSLCQQGENSQNLVNNYSDAGELTLILSLFHFLNNLHDINLSTQQTNELDNEQQIIIAALGGALSGAYNGLSSIPSSWRNSCQKKDYYRYIISKTEDIMGKWLGRDPAKEIKHSPSIVTSVGVLQPRNNLKIISQ